MYNVYQAQWSDPTFICWTTLMVIDEFELPTSLHEDTLNAMSYWSNVIRLETNNTLECNCQVFTAQ